MIPNKRRHKRYIMVLDNFTLKVTSGSKEPELYHLKDALVVLPFGTLIEFEGRKLLTQERVSVRISEIIVKG